MCGTALLLRHARGALLTPAGLELVAHARNVVDELARLDQVLSDYSNGVRGHVRLVANATSIAMFLAQDIASFLRLHPTVKIDLTERSSAQVLRSVQDGSGDVGVALVSDPAESLVVQSYRDFRLVVVVPRRHPLARRKRVRFADTLDFDHVGLPRGNALSDALFRAAASEPKPLRLRIQATSLDDLRRLVAAGLGIGVLPGGSVTPFLQLDKVCAIALDEPWAMRELRVLTRERSTLLNMPRLFAEHLVQCARRAPGLPVRDGSPAQQSLVARPR
jgi:DNA-binding transcriptional LysR family regulator